MGMTMTMLMLMLMMVNGDEGIRGSGGRDRDGDGEVTLARLKKETERGSFMCVWRGRTGKAWLGKASSQPTFVVCWNCDCT